MLNLYMVHLGFYDPTICSGVYEHHINLFVVAESFDDAKAQVKLKPEYVERKMHVDGVQKVEAIDGVRIECRRDESLNGATIMDSLRYRALAPVSAGG